MKKATAILAVLLLLSASGVFAGGQSGDTAAAAKVVVKTMAYGDQSNPEGVNWLRIVDYFEKDNPITRRWWPG
jgi:raffinose/stachyose/melibiose transport system substrate-binding protein